MSLSITDLLNPLTGDQIRANMVTALVGMGIPADKWKQGGVASTILTIVAQMFAAFQNLIVQGIGSAFLPTATGGWLTLVALNVFNVARITATFATGNLTLTNSGGGTFTFAAEAAQFQDSATSKTYVNSASFTLLPSSSLTIPITAMEIGTASNAIIGGVDTIVTSMLSVSCTNTAPVLGTDDESDTALRARCVAKLGSLSVRGPRNAYSYAVLSALNAGVPVNINRVAVNVTPATGTVNVYMASPSGPPTTGDFAAAEANVEAIARPDAVSVLYFAASTVPYTAHITVWTLAVPGLAAADFVTGIQAALDTFFETYPIGGISASGFAISQGVFASNIDGIIKAAFPSIFAISGAVDLALTGAQVAINNVALTIIIETLPQ